MPGGGTPEPSAEEQEQQTAVARETLKLWVGSLAQEGDDEMLGQEKIEVPRFGSHRLGEPSSEAVFRVRPTDMMSAAR